MKPSPILEITLRWLIVHLGIVSFFLLLRGHDEPGGGFSGGLLAASAIIIITIANGADAGRKLLHFHPLSYIAVGLLLAVFSGIFHLNISFLTAVWVKIPFGDAMLKIGSPLLFDCGVYLVVLGVISSFVLEIESTVSHEKTNHEKDKL